jgi:hypothetical protein
LRRRRRSFCLHRQFLHAGEIKGPGGDHATA